MKAVMFFLMIWVEKDQLSLLMLFKNLFESQKMKIYQNWVKCEISEREKYNVFISGHCCLCYSNLLVLNYKLCLLFFSNLLWVEIFRGMYVVNHKTRFDRLFWTNCLISLERKRKKIHNFIDKRQQKKWRQNDGFLKNSL